jgi:hypothetical protein
VTVEISDHSAGSDLIRLISALPYAARSRLIALLYAVDDAVEVRSELQTSPDRYRFVLEVMIQGDAPLGNVAGERDC